MSSTVPASAPGAELPLACTLGPADGAARMRRWARLHQTAAPLPRLVGGVLEVRYQAGPGVAEELASLAAAEQACCAFATWTVTESGDQLLLRVAASPGAGDGVYPIAVMFGVTDRPGQV